VIATARLVAAPGGRITRLRSEPPLTLRATPDAVYLVGSAGGPLGGDDLRIEIDVEAGACLTVRSAAASVALPGPGPRPSPSSLTVEARVAAGGELRWLVEPTVAARGCRHRMAARIDLDDGARLTWFEEIVLGRYGERAGSITSRLSIDIAGRPLLRHDLALGPDHPASATSAVVGDARAVGTAVIAGRGLKAAHVLGPTAAVMPLAGPGFQAVALASDRLTLRRLLEQVSSEPSLSTAHG
jgi:urease accessory protein